MLGRINNIGVFGALIKMQALLKIKHFVSCLSDIYCFNLCIAFLAAFLMKVNPVNPSDARNLLRFVSILKQTGSIPLFLEYQTPKKSSV